MLKFKYHSQNQIPQEHRALYTERDGAWFLDAENVIGASRFDELRKQNTTLNDQLAALQKRFQGIDPDDVRTQLAEKQRLEEEKALKAGEFDKILESRTRALKTDFDQRYSALTAERDSLNARLTDIQINQGVIVAGTRRGLRSSAIPDITARARSTFKLVSGIPRAFDPDGTTVRVGRDGITPMTVEEWIDSQLSAAPHLFESNSGSGAVGSGSPANVDRDNPWNRETWNLTKQGELIRRDPARARALQSAARK